MSFPNPFKPWFVYRPGQFVRRLVRTVFPPVNPIIVTRLPWNCPIEIDIRETIGKSIWTTGVYDLAVAEVLYRLADPQRISLDVGANIGALTGLLATRSKAVWAFEPHPDVYRRLVGNIARFAGQPGFAPCEAFELAASERNGTANLELPAGFGENQGLARVSGDPGANGVTIRTVRLDSLLEDTSVGLMKMDVEGHELSVLRGAAHALERGQIEHIVYEDHEGSLSPVGQFLTSCGYTIFGIGWRVGGLTVGPPQTIPCRSYEAPNFLATRRPDETLARCRLGGWKCLRPSPRSVGDS
jgi:FkbM family methyltransferase